MYRASNRWALVLKCVFMVQNAANQQGSWAVTCMVVQVCTVVGTLGLPGMFEFVQQAGVCCIGRT